jgi:cell division protein FtsA
MPVRIARPENLVGLVDQLQSPAYATSVGLLKWSELMETTTSAVPQSRHSSHLTPMKGVNINWDKVKNW